MSIATLLLILLSAALHTAWHSMAKKEEASPAFFALAMAAPVVILLPAMVWQQSHRRQALLEIYGVHCDSPVIGIITATTSAS